MCLSWKDPPKSNFLIQPKDIRSGSVSNREVSQGRIEARKWHCHCTVVLIWGEKNHCGSNKDSGFEAERVEAGDQLGKLRSCVISMEIRAATIQADDGERRDSFA